jgi:hypothetical protein
LPIGFLEKSPQRTSNGELMPTADAANSIVVKKSAPYRGTTKVWSNRYHFDGDLPPDPTHWTTLCDAVVAAEKTIFESATEIIQIIGYDAGSASSSNPHGDAVFTKDYTQAGTFAPATGDVGAPGDCASIIRYSTPDRSTKNHPIYLMNYYHGVFRAASDPDTLAADQKTALEAYADDWLAGFSDGAETHVRCRPNGNVAIGRRVDPYVRHRDFPT